MSILPALFDRLDAAQAGSDAAIAAQWNDCIAHDLEALLNTRSALLPHVLAPYPGVNASVVNYGLIDFAAMCMTSDTDQQLICASIRMAIERHEPRLHMVAVTLQRIPGVANRVDFVISAQLRKARATAPLQFSAVFRPSHQQYCVRAQRG